MPSLGFHVTSSYYLAMLLENPDKWDNFLQFSLCYVQCMSIGTHMSVALSSLFPYG